MKTFFCGLTAGATGTSVLNAVTYLDMALTGRTWSRLAAEQAKVGSMLCLRLYTESDNLGGLNLYSFLPDGFDEHDHDYGLALAAHIAVA